MSLLKQAIDKRKVLLAAHRGVNGGNIPCNSMECYRIALFQDADIIEMDVTACKDKEELFMLHPGMEPVHTTAPAPLHNFTKKEVEGFVLKNQDLTPTQYPLITFGEALDELKGKCFINVDKFWDNPKEIAQEIRKRNMQDQVIVKSSPTNGKIMDAIEEFAPDMQFLAIVSSPEKAMHEELKRRKINYVGVEILFDTDDHPFISDDYISAMHDEGKVVWVNTIVYNYKDVLSAGHTDDVAMLGNPDYGWGFIAEKKVDIIQTDWLLPCSEYLKRKGYRI
jgi:glycerophosphoryl diester phosphodiesterase